VLFCGVRELALTFAGDACAATFDLHKVRHQTFGVVVLLNYLRYLQGCNGSHEIPILVENPNVDLAGQYGFDTERLKSKLLCRQYLPHMGNRLAYIMSYLWQYSMYYGN